MNKEQQTTINKIVGSNIKPLSGFSNGATTDIKLKTSTMFPTSIILVKKEIVITLDGGLFEEPQYHEVLENGECENMNLNDFQVIERNKILASFNEYEV